ncbi:MAG TPA: RidA family protein [Gemmatimonadales bacterium]|nr:RidA family protein [Gemmatimonadales bacterium]
MMRRHDPDTVPSPEGGYSHGVEVGGGQRLLYISGQIPVTPDGAVAPDFDGQCTAVWANVLAVLDSAGLGPEHLVKVTTYLTDRSQADANGRIRRAHLGDARPALTVIVAQTLESPWLLEIEAIAAAPVE